MTLANSFDLDGRLAAIDAFDGATPVLDLDYAFDLAGNITDIDDIGGGSRGRDYAYDELHRLTQGKELAPGGAPVTLQTDYSYDAVGNRLTRDVGGALETLAYDAFSNRLETVTAGVAVRTLGYTDSGNTASDDDGLGTVLTHNYDSADRLVEVKQGQSTLAEYVHNAPVSARPWRPGGRYGLYLSRGPRTPARACARPATGRVASGSRRTPAAGRRA